MGTCKTRKISCLNTVLFTGKKQRILNKGIAYARIFALLSFLFHVHFLFQYVCQYTAIDISYLHAAGI